MRPAHALLAVLLVAGCHVPDQTDVPIALGGAPPFQKPEPPKPAPAPSGPRPLVTIRPTPGVSYDAALRLAVTAARARKEDVAFDVVSVVPAAGTADQQVSAASAGTDAAAAVARGIVRLGVPASRVVLSAATDPQVTDQEIHVFVH